jgi:uncharacterized membrane protein YbhN (UPF0104 family)
MAAPAVSIDVSASDPLAALRRAAAGGSSTPRRAGMALGAVALVAAVALAAPRVGQAFADALVRAVHADPRWVAAGVAFELASFAGYVVLFWHVAGRVSERIGLRASWDVALASTAATRLLPTAGAGGAALTFWSLRRAGHSSRGASSTLLTFLVVLYSVFLGSLAVAGALLATGAVGGGAGVSVSFELSAAPAGAAAAAIGLALVLAVRAGQRDAAGSSGSGGRVRSAAHALGGSVREALAVVRRPHVRLLGAPAWWGFDMLVLWATFNAFGHSPAPLVLVLGYFLGQVANTVPLPGAASGGMVGAFLAVGMPAEVTLPAVLAYRAIAIWTPVPAGALALGGLRRTVARWAAEDEAAADVAAAAPEPAVADEPAAPGSQRGRPVEQPARPVERRPPARRRDEHPARAPRPRRGRCRAGRHAPARAGPRSPPARHRGRLVRPPPGAPQPGPARHLSRRVRPPPLAAQP